MHVDNLEASQHAVFDHQDSLTSTPIDLVNLLVWSWIKSKVKGFFLTISTNGAPNHLDV